MSPEQFAQDLMKQLVVVGRLTAGEPPEYAAEVARHVVVQAARNFRAQVVDEVLESQRATNNTLMAVLGRKA